MASWIPAACAWARHGVTTSAKRVTDSPQSSSPRPPVVMMIVGAPIRAATSMVRFSRSRAWAASPSLAKANARWVKPAAVRPLSRILAAAFAAPNSRTGTRSGVIACAPIRATVSIAVPRSGSAKHNELIAMPGLIADSVTCVLSSLAGSSDCPIRHGPHRGIAIAVGVKAVIAQRIGKPTGAVGQNRSVIDEHDPLFPGQLA